MINIEVDQKAIQDIQNKFWWATIQKMLNTSIRKSIILLQRYAIEETPVDQWRLRSWFQTEFSDSFWRLFNPVQYAVYVHEWTKPHSAPFTPIALRAERHWLNPWSVWLAIKRKWTKANPFMDRAVERAEDEIDDIFQREIDFMVKEMVS